MRRRGAGRARRAATAGLLAACLALLALAVLWLLPDAPPTPPAWRPVAAAPSARGLPEPSPLPDPAPAPVEPEDVAPPRAAPHRQRAAPAALERTCTVAVVDSSGEPVPGASVSVWSIEPGDPEWPGRVVVPWSKQWDLDKLLAAACRLGADPRHDAPTVRAVTDAEGLVTVATRDPSALLLAEHPALGASGLWSCQGLGRRVDVQLALQPPARLIGRVVDATREPVAGALVDFALEPSTRRAGRLVPRLPAPLLTDGEGRFEVALDAPFDGRVTAWARGAETAPARLSIDPGAEQHVELRVPGGLVVTGTVRGPGGGPPAHARVRLGDLTVDTGPDGAFRIAAPSPGSYLLSVHAIGLVQDRACIVQLDDDHPVTHVEVTLAAPWNILRAPIAGVVVDASGRPLEGAAVRARQPPPARRRADETDEFHASEPAAALVATATTGADGSFALPGMQRGVYYELECTAGAATATRHRVAAGEADVVLRLREPPAH